MNNAEIASMLNEFADMMDLQGDVFKRNAYRRAAQRVEGLDGDINEYRRRRELESIPGVGRAIARKIEEMVDTGRSAKLEELRREFPQGVVELMRVPEIGPKAALRLFRELGVKDLEGLKEAAERHRVRELKGFGERKEENILKGIALVQDRGDRMLLGDVLPVAESMVRYLQQRCCQQASVAGSLRRRKDTVGDIDLLVGSDEPRRAMDEFAAQPSVESVVSRGATRSTVRLADGTQVDLRVVPRSNYGAALQYFTGSKEHNVEMRRIALQKGYKLNEYGLFRKDDGSPAAGEDEDAIYRALGLDPVPPELRENRGEIEAAENHRLPDLVRLEDIQGDLHVHTVMSDGHATMREIAEEARRRGYRYIGVADHSRSLRIANGLSVDDLLASVEEARQLTEEVGIPVLRGAEVDILKDGSLDYPDDVLAELDYVIGSVHSRFKMERGEMTDRVLVAIKNSELNILGHPTGRLIGKREGYQIDLDEVMAEVVRRGVVMEINGFPDRMDLNDLNCRKARERGIMMVLDTDAHRLEQLDYMRLAVGTARRGWLTSHDVLNAQPLDEVRRILGKGTA
jgi:DNA polymerase (family 10)